MRYATLTTAIAVLILMTLVIGCNDGQYSNPASPDASSTAWRTLTFTDVGGTYDFSDIGIYIIVPPDTLEPGDVYSCDVRGFPSGIPVIPTGPVLIRLGTFELFGPDADFLREIEVRFRIADNRSPGLNSRGYALDDNNIWHFSQNAPVLGDGMHCVMHIASPGIYGAFEPVDLHVEATVSQQSSPIPLSVGFKAIASGGHPPYGFVWDFGDNSDPVAGQTVAHAYVDPGDYTATVMVTDSVGHTATDWIYLTAYYIASPPALP